MHRIGKLNNKEQMMEMTEKSIEARKDGKAGMKQAITNGTKAAFWETNAKTKYQNKRLKEPVLNYLIEQMFGDDGKWVKAYIDSQLKEAKNDPNSKAAERISAGLFNADLWNEIDRYIQQANKEDNDYIKYLIRQTLYDKQQEVYDNDIDKTILIINSRRSGKTECMGRIVAKGLLRPDAHVVYINRSSAAAIRQIRGPLQAALESTNGRLRIIKGSIEGQEVHFNNGGQLLIIGQNNAADIDKMRGERISLCIMDECAHQRYTKQVLREVIGPAMKDYADSQLVMVGTPPRIPHTYIEDLWNNPMIKKYHWTFQDNPFIPNRDKVIEEVCEEYGVSEDSAFIQREYYGRMDAYDDDAKWIKKYSIIENQELPKNVSHAFVGVDWGYEDRAAVVSVIADEVTKRAYVVDCWSEARKGIVEISNEIKRQVESLKEKYHPNRRVMVICDNNEKGAVVDLVKVYKIPNVYTAYKYDKDMALDQLNDFLGGNRIVFLKDHSNACIEDADSTVWKRDEETDKIMHEIDDDVWHPNALMALLYVSRQFAYDVCRYIDRNKQARNVLSGRDRDDDLEEVFIASNI